jgi:hypothetical protein
LVLESRLRQLRNVDRNPPNGVSTLASARFILVYDLRGKNLTCKDFDPRAQGGKTEWNNISSSCRPCNSSKRDRTPEQAGMRLLRKPYRPKALPLGQPVLAMREIPPEWEPYLVGIT